MSLQDLANGDWSLDCIYPYQFVQNEILKTNRGASKYTIHQITRTPVLRTTMTGTIYVGSQAVQTYFANNIDKFVFTDLGNPEIKAVEGELNKMTGELSLTWNTEPGENHIVVSYEYSAECQLPPPSKKPAGAINPKELKHVTFEKFFCHTEVEELLANAGTVCVWDFNTALGESIKEKYETLYYKVSELSNVLMKKGASGYFWIVCSPEVASIFETATHGFYPLSSEEFESYYGKNKQVPMGGWTDQLQYRGLIHSKWRLYVDPKLDMNRVLIGANDTKGDPLHYGRMSICNFII